MITNEERECKTHGIHTRFIKTPSMQYHQCWYCRDENRKANIIRRNVKLMKKDFISGVLVDRYRTESLARMESGEKLERIDEYLKRVSGIKYMYMRKDVISMLADMYAHALAGGTLTTFMENNL